MNTANCLALLLLCGCVTQPQWVAAWAHAPTAYNRGAASTTARPPAYAPLPPYYRQTVRQLVRLAVDARSLRIRLSNEFGDTPLQIGEAHIAMTQDGGDIVPGTDHVMTFAGHRSISIPAGAPELSDPILWAVPALSRLSVSLYYPQQTLPPAHNLYANHAYVADGNVAGAASIPTALEARTGNHLSQIEVVSAHAWKTVVAFGDSITEGVASTPGGFQGWTDRLAQRLGAKASTRHWSIVSAGIGSNRLLHDTPSSNALARFDRDVLSVPGVSLVIVLLGINDIQYAHRQAEEAVSADQMIGALEQLTLRAHARCIRVLGATMTAFEGSPDYTEEGERLRQDVNHWIRSSAAFDGLIDFDLCTRDPAHPSRLLPTLESSGHLHPNDAGYAAMGDAINLRYFR